MVLVGRGDRHRAGYRLRDLVMTGPIPPLPPTWRWLSAIKGLTITNAIVIGMLAVIAVPTWFAYSMTQNTELLDRFFSNYREIASQNVACSVREAKYRGGNPLWSISTGFAFVGNDRYVIAVVLEHQPRDEEIHAFCETLKLLADTIGREVIEEVNDAN